MSSSGSKKWVAHQLRALQSALPGLVRTAQQSLATHAKQQPPLTPPPLVNGDASLFWAQSGALKSNLEFKQHLHIWIMSEENSKDIGHVDTHYSVPWVPLWDRPDISEISAYYHVTKFAMMPSGWDDLWPNISMLIDIKRERRRNVHGPYWKLKDNPAIAFLAGEMVDMKRRIAREAFDRHAIDSLQFQRSLLRDALEPFRVMTVQQEKEDEAARVDEERATAVSIGNRTTSGGPPRCR